MNRAGVLVLLHLLGVSVLPAAAQGTQSTTPKGSSQPAATTTVAPLGLHVEQRLQELPSEALRHLDTSKAAIQDVTDSRAIIDETLVKDTKQVVKPDPDSKDFYCLIHVLSWKTTTNAAASGGDQPGQKAEVAADTWYVYHAGRWTQADFSSNKRVFGVKRIWLLFIHLNLPQAEYLPRYQFSVTSKPPAILADLAGLASLFFTAGGGALSHGWGGGYVDVHDVPSDILVQPLLVNQTAKSNEYTKLATPAVFDNEGRYWIDFSVGVPIKSGKELSVDTDTNTVSPKKVDKQHIFALVDLFARPVDVKNLGFNRWPHLVTGIAIAKQPLHSIIVAAGWGPAFAHFYLGAMFVKQPAHAGSPAEWDPQLAFGINLTVRGTMQVLNKAAK